MNIKDTPKKQPRIEEELAPEDEPLYDHGDIIIKFSIIYPWHDSSYQAFIDLTRPDKQKEGQKLNLDLVKVSPIKDPPKTLEINIFNSGKRQHSIRQNINGWVNQLNSKSFSQAVPRNFGINGYMLRENLSVWNNSSR